MGRYYPSQAELDKIKRDKEGPTMVDEMKSMYQSAADRIGGTYLNSAEELKKKLKEEAAKRK